MIGRGGTRRQQWRERNVFVKSQHARQWQSNRQTFKLKDKMHMLDGRFFLTISQKGKSSILLYRDYFVENSVA